MPDGPVVQKVKLTTTQIVVLIAAIGVLAGLLSGYFGHQLLRRSLPGNNFYPIFDTFDMEPDERPPIIVNNSSVILQPAYHPTKGRGQWMGSAKKYVHSHGNLPVVLLQFHAIATDPSTAAGCKHQDSVKYPGTYQAPLSEKNLTIRYIQSGAEERSVKFKITGHDLDIDFDEAPSYTSGTETLTLVSDKTKPVIVEIGKFTCTYEPASSFRFEIHQLK